MKRLVWLLFLIGSPAMAATPAIIAHSIAQTVNYNNVTTSGINCTGANFRAVAVSHFTGSPTVTDSAGDTLTALTKRSSGAGGEVSVFYVLGITGGTGETATVTSSGTAPTVSYSCWSNVQSFDRQNGAVSAASITSLATGSVTPTDTGALTFAAVSAPLASAGWAVNSSFTLLDSAVETMYAFGLGVGYKIGNAGAQNPTFSWTTASDAAAEIAVFNSVGSSGTASRRYVGALRSGARSVR